METANDRFAIPAKGWQSGATPQAAPGTRVAEFASGLNHARRLHVLPNGDVRVAETHAPSKPEAAEGGMPSDAPVDVLTGFLSEEDSAYGRSVWCWTSRARCWWPTMWAR